VRLMVPAAVEHLSRGRGHALRISTFCDLDHVDRWKAVAASLVRGLSYRTSQMLSALGSRPRLTDARSGPHAGLAA
jgi:hypothetical protein